MTTGLVATGLGVLVAAGCVTVGELPPGGTVGDWMDVWYTFATAALLT